VLLEILGFRKENDGNEEILLHQESNDQNIRLALNIISQISQPIQPK